MFPLNHSGRGWGSERRASQSRGDASSLQEPVNVGRLIAQFSEFILVELESRAEKDAQRGKLSPIIYNKQKERIEMSS